MELLVPVELLVPDQMKEAERPNEGGGPTYWVFDLLSFPLFWYTDLTNLAGIFFPISLLALFTTLVTLAVYFS